MSSWQQRLNMDFPYGAMLAMSWPAGADVSYPIPYPAYIGEHMGKALVWLQSTNAEKDFVISVDGYQYVKQVPLVVCLVSGDERFYLISSLDEAFANDHAAEREATAKSALEALEERESEL